MDEPSAEEYREKAMAEIAKAGEGWSDHADYRIARAQVYATLAISLQMAHDDWWRRV